MNTLRLEANIPLATKKINYTLADFEQTVEKMTEAFRTKALVKMVQGCEELLFHEFVGTKKKTPWSCPQCKSKRKFRRRGWRSRERKLATTQGKLSIPFRMVECRCGCKFAPMLQVLGIDRFERTSKLLSRLAIETVIFSTYRRAARTLRRLRGVFISAWGIHRIVQRLGNSCVITPTIRTASSLQLDGTMVPAGPRPRGCDIFLGIAIRGKKSAFSRHLVFFSMKAGWEALKKSMKKFYPRYTVVDGEMGLWQKARDALPKSFIRRCHWHLAYDFKDINWHDGLRQATSKKYYDSLYSALGSFKNGHSIRARKKLRKLIRSLELRGCLHTVSYLKHALPFLFPRSKPPKYSTTTSIAEREMREINRRTNVSARWSVKGVGNILALLLAFRYKHKAWSDLFPQCKTLKFTLNIKTLVQAEVAHVNA